MRQIGIIFVSMAVAAGACKKNEESADNKAATETAAKVAQEATTTGEQEPAAKVDEMPVTTSSEEARAKFLEARELIEWGHFEKAAPLLAEALKLDPNFAQATMWTGITQPADQVVKTMARAVELAKDAPVPERLFITAFQANLEGDIDKAIATYEALLKEIPTSWRAQLYAS